MLVVDADTHVDETEATWEHFEESKRAHRPRAVAAGEGVEAGAGVGGRHGLWLIDGQYRVRRYRSDKITGTTRETRELHDVDARLRDMDRLGVDVQVIYPTLCLSPHSSNPEVELALCQSYNRWLADRTAQSKGRLRWVAVLPMLSIDRAVEELRFAVDHGACGALKGGIECGRPASDPYFFPIYEEASRLNVPICFHIGAGDRGMFDPSANLKATSAVLTLHTISGFSALIAEEVPEKFTNLRFGWIEASASWVPYMIHDLERRLKKEGIADYDLKNVFRRNRFYVTCDTGDDLPHILNFGLEDSLMIGSDYTHGDPASEIDAVRRIDEKGQHGEISREIAHKIISDNPVRFYGI